MTHALWIWALPALPCREIVLFRPVSARENTQIPPVTTPQSHLIPVAILDADTTGEALPQQASAHLSAVKRVGDWWVTLNETSLRNGVMVM